MFDISKTIPNKLTISIKENIPALTGTVIYQKYYLSIDDYQSIILVVNGLIDHLDFIYPQINNLNFSSQTKLRTGVTHIITSNFTSITGIVFDNGLSSITDMGTTNINVLTSFNINNNFYTYNVDNKGNVVVIDNLISGGNDNLVHTFNGKNGDVTGITGILLNGEKLELNNGLVNLDQLSYKHIYIKSINNSVSNINVPCIITTIKESKYDNIAITPSNNEGEITLNNFLLRHKNENNKLLLTDNNTKFKLNTTDITNNKSAINKKFVDNNQLNDLIIKKQVTSKTFTLPSSYYPLHFYDAEGNWVNNIKWSIIKDTNNTITILNEVINIQGMILTAMKVKE